MSISIVCPSCKTKLKVSDQAAGKTLRGKACPICTRTFDITIPSTSSAPPPMATFAPPLAMQASPSVDSAMPLAQSSPLRGKAWGSMGLGLCGCLLKALIKGGVNHATLGIAPVGDWLIDGWDMWHNEKPSEEAKQKEMREMINATLETRDKHLEEMIQAIAGDKSAEAKQELKTYLKQIPSLLQRSMRASSDSNGNSPPPSLIMRSAADLAAVLQIGRAHV